MARQFVRVHGRVTQVVVEHERQQPDALGRHRDGRQQRDRGVLRREMIVMKRALWPLRDAVAGLSRAERPFVTPETKVYLNDTLDHATSLIEIVETHRDVLTGLIDMHLSLGQARTSDVISVLTIVTSIFIPLTFLAGIWGMNFDPDSSPWNMPELRAWYGYPAALGFMAFVAIMLAIYFKWRKWL